MFSSVRVLVAVALTGQNHHCWRNPGVCSWSCHVKNPKCQFLMLVKVALSCRCIIFAGKIMFFFSAYATPFFHSQIIISRCKTHTCHSGIQFISSFSPAKSTCFTYWNPNSWRFARMKSTFLSHPQHFPGFPSCASHPKPGLAHSAASGFKLAPAACVDDCFGRRMSYEKLITNY